jgi:hypothetical protein
VDRFENKLPVAKSGVWGVSRSPAAAAHALFLAQNLQPRKISYVKPSLPATDLLPLIPAHGANQAAQTDLAERQKMGQVGTQSALELLEERRCPAYSACWRGDAALPNRGSASQPIDAREPATAISC